MTEPTTRVLSVPEPPSARFDLRCWGEFRLFDRLQGEERSPHQRKARAIIAYLALHGGSLVGRERLASLLWSERGDEQARASLRQTLLGLRPYATGAASLLMIGRDQVGLNVLALTSDIGRIEALARADDLDALVQALPDKDDRLYGGLDGLDPAFDEWLTLERRLQQDRLLSLGAAAAARGLECGACETVSRLATELQTLDDTNESVAQIGMRADHACGDRSAVRRRYRRLCEALKAELGVAPSQEIEALLGELTGGKRPSSAGSEPASAPQDVPTPPPYIAPPSIAVLPFINRSGLQADEAFADGMVEDLTAALSTRSRTKVVAASATAAYRNGARDLRQIGRDLGVRYLLEGNVRRVGKVLRVTAQLVEAETESILWTEKFDRPLTELVAQPEGLVTEVAAHLGVQVQRFEMEHALKTPGEIGPWEAAMRGMAYARLETRSGWETAVAEAKRRVKLNPNDGEAYAALAAAQARLVTFSGGDDPELAREIIGNVRRARALDPTNPHVLLSIASALPAVGKLQDALPLAERAVAINPNFVQAHLCLGAILVRLGRSDEAITELDATEHLAPNSFWLYYWSVWRAVAHLQAGRLEQALAAADRAVRLFPGTLALIQSMLCSAKLDRWDRARDASRRLRDADPENSRAQIENLVRDFYSGSNAADEYVAIARKIWDQTPSEPKSA